MLHFSVYRSIEKQKTFILFVINSVVINIRKVLKIKYFHFDVKKTDHKNYILRF